MGLEALGLPDPDAEGRRYVCVVVVMAVCAEHDFMLTDGSRGKKGDYICRDEYGDVFVIPRQRFENSYIATKETSLAG